MITDNVEQRSLEWHRMRCGCITGSKVADIMKAGRKKDEIFPRQLKRIFSRLQVNACLIQHS